VNPPQPGEVYRHFKGGVYRVVTVALDEGSGIPQVVYTGPTGTYTRPLVDFLGTVCRDGYEGPRFVLVEPAPPTMPDPITMLRALCAVVYRDSTVVMGTPMDPDEAFNAIIESGKAARTALGLAVDGSEDCDENGDGPPPKLRPLLDGSPVDEITRARSYEAATRETITWSVSGPAEADRMNALLELDFTRKERDLLVEVFKWYLRLDHKFYIARDFDEWVIEKDSSRYRRGKSLGEVLRKADLPDHAEVVEKLIETLRS
jgi:hypothetical protein